jgi:hypothetical protein
MIPRMSIPMLRHSSARQLRSEQAVVLGERTEGWEAHRDAIINSIAPGNALEAALAQRAALLLWRLNRVVRFETGAVGLAINTVDKDDKRIFADKAGYIRRRLEEHKTALTVLAGLDTEAPTAAVSGEAALGAIALNLCLDEYPDDMASKLGITGTDGWTYQHVREAIKILTPDPEGTVQGTVKYLAHHIKNKERKLAKARDWERLQIETRILPDPTTLERIARYETHLTRQLTTTLACLAGVRGMNSFGKKPVLALEDHS